MQTLRDYLCMIKKTNGDKLFLSFLIFYFIDCFFLYLLDPALDNYFDALWMGFSISTTIGLGDYTVTSAAARFCAILLGVYGCVIEAYIPGLIASYYLQNLSEKRNRIVSSHMEELSHLDTMSSEQKKNLSSTIRQEASAK